MNKQRKIKIYYKAAVIIGILCFFSTGLLASKPNIITVGLESIGKDQGNVRIESQSNLSVGYLDGEFFRPLDVLDTNSVTIAKDTSSYYFTGSVYSTLREARAAAASYDSYAAAAYAEANTYYVYTTKFKEGLMPAPASTSRLAVYDSSNRVILISDNGKVPLLLQGFDNSAGLPLTQIAGRKYRGAVGAVSGQNGGVTAVNVVDLEEYLYGVVPVEMAPSWPVEALKAQAVAARSIAYVQYNRFISKGYNVVDTTLCQVYRGYSAESPNSNQAVDETRGEVIKYNNQVAEALYFSTSGGVTEDAKYIWGNDVPYLKAVQDVFETEPAQKPWTRTITLNEINTCLLNQGVNIGQLKGIEISSRTPNGRVQTLTFLGTTGSHTIKNENTRTFFSGTKEGSLKSRLYSFSNFIGTPSVTQGNISSIYMMSSDNMIEKDLKGISIMSFDDLVVMPASPVIESSETTSVLSPSVSGGTGAALQTETVFGDLIIYGQGFGHGLGMSQSGARGMAKAGYNYRDILTYYYSGITVER